MNSVIPVNVTAAQICRFLASLDLARHGNAPRIEGIPTHDLRNHNRPLSGLGRRQAVRTLEKMGSRVYDLVVASPLARAKETAEIITSVNPEVLECLGWDPTPGTSLISLFARMGERGRAYAPLSEYFAQPDADVLKEWVWNALLGIVLRAEQQSAYLGGPISMFIGGHAICQEAVAWAIGEVLIQGSRLGGEGMQHRMLSMTESLGEAEVLGFDFNETGIIAHHRYRPEMG